MLFKNRTFGPINVWRFIFFSVTFQTKLQKREKLVDLTEKTSSMTKPLLNCFFYHISCTNKAVTYSRREGSFILFRRFNSR